MLEEAGIRLLVGGLQLGLVEAWQHAVEIRTCLVSLLAMVAPLGQVPATQVLEALPAAAMTIWVRVGALA